MISEAEYGIVPDSHTGNTGGVREELLQCSKPPEQAVFVVSSDHQSLGVTVQNVAFLTLRNGQPARLRGADADGKGRSVRFVRGETQGLQLVTDADGERGFAVDQGFKVALNHRILREGTGVLTDGLLRDLIGQWRTWESHFGVAIDLRTFALVAASHAEFGPRIRELGGVNTATQITMAEAAGVLSGLLWPRTGEIRSRIFQSYMQFRSRGYTDPSFVRELIFIAGPEPITYGSESWHDDFTKSLADTGIARVWVSVDHEAEFHEEIYKILADPVDVDYLQFYPVITEVSRGPGTSITFVLREMF